MRSCLVALGMFVSVRACSERYEAAAPDEPQLQTMEAGVAADLMAASRCDHAGMCGAIGDGKRFSNRDACTDELRAYGRRALRPEDCPAGVLRSRLEACLIRLVAAPCTTPDDLPTDPSCKAGALCAPPALSR